MAHAPLEEDRSTTFFAVRSIFSPGKRGGRPPSEPPLSISTPRGGPPPKLVGQKTSALCSPSGCLPPEPETKPRTQGLDRQADCTAAGSYPCLLLLLLLFSMTDKKPAAAPSLPATKPSSLSKNTTEEHSEPHARSEERAKLSFDPSLEKPSKTRPDGDAHEPGKPAPAFNLSASIPPSVLEKVREMRCAFAQLHINRCDL